MDGEVEKRAESRRRGESGRRGGGAREGRGNLGCALAIVDYLLIDNSTN